MINLDRMWSEDLLDITQSYYNNNYDYRIHAVQSALLIIFQNSTELSNLLYNSRIEYNSLTFGYHGHETDEMCKVFAKRFGCEPAYTKNFYDTVFYILSEYFSVKIFYSPINARLHILNVQDINCDGVLSDSDIDMSDFGDIHVHQYHYIQDVDVGFDYNDMFDYTNYGTSYVSTNKVTTVDYTNTGVIIYDNVLFSMNNITPRRGIPPKPIEHPGGIIEMPDGTLNYPDGTVVHPDGTTMLPDGIIITPNGNVQYPTNDKNLYNQGTNMIIKPNGAIVSPEEEYPNGLPPYFANTADDDPTNDSWRPDGNGGFESFTPDPEWVESLRPPKPGTDTSTKPSTTPSTTPSTKPSTTPSTPPTVNTPSSNIPKPSTGSTVSNPQFGATGEKDFIYILGNELSNVNLQTEYDKSWTSNSVFPIRTVKDLSFEESEKHNPFFKKDDSDITRKSGYDITIVYGPNKQHYRKLCDVIPRSKSQEVNSSGEAIYDIIEFIARDVVEKRR